MSKENLKVLDNNELVEIEGGGLPVIAGVIVGLVIIGGAFIYGVVTGYNERKKECETTSQTVYQTVYSSVYSK